MTWEARIISPAERDRFNAFVARSPKGHILQSYEWGNVKGRTGWEPIRFVIEDDGEIIAAIAILKRVIPGFRYSILYAPRGPVLDIHDSRLFDYLLYRLQDVARQHKAILLKIDPDVPVQDAAFTDYLRRAGFRPAQKGVGFEGVQPRFVFRLDITPDLDQLMANLHPKTRYNLRLAQKKGVTVRVGTRADLEPFYRILVETAERDRFLIRSFDYFAILWDELVENSLARLFMADYEGQPIAGALAFTIGDKAWYIYGASSNRHRNVMPNYLLQWEMITWAKSLGCTMYDFRGVPGHLAADNPLYGLYRFKKGFNGTYTEFVGEYDLVYSPFFYWLWNTAEPLYAKGIRRLSRLKKALRKGAK